LLHYSQVGRLSLDFRDTDLAAVLAESTEMLGARLTDTKVELRVPRPLPTVHCDRARVREIFSNLISNAAKYNDKTPAWVEVGYVGVDDPGSALARPPSTPAAAQADTLFYVRDNGIGIEERHRERVFGIFKRLHAQDAFGGGSGAGLTIARKMVEQHKGVVWFDSQAGQGTTFFFTLPGQAVPQAGSDAA
jgi:light-regulated signal transduction histidine kinase (bacteriophytochrome)